MCLPAGGCPAFNSFPSLDDIMNYVTIQQNTNQNTNNNLHEQAEISLR